MNQRRGPGKIKRKLALLLLAQGYQVDPSELYDQKGAWRTDDRLDVCCWEAALRRVSDGYVFAVQCWFTMTQCVRYGVTVNVKDGDVSANMSIADDCRKREQEAKRNTRRGRWARATIAREKAR